MCEIVTLWTLVYSYEKICRGVSFGISFKPKISLLLKLSTLLNKLCQVCLDGVLKFLGQLISDISKRMIQLYKKGLQQEFISKNFRLLQSCFQTKPVPRNRFRKFDSTVTCSLLLWSSRSYVFEKKDVLKVSQN